VLYRQRWVTGCARVPDIRAVVFILQAMSDVRMTRSTTDERGTVAVLERLCSRGNEQACQTLSTMCEEGTDTACRSVR